MQHAVFPVCFAHCRQKKITQGRFLLLCFLVNLGVSLLFWGIEGSLEKPPYFLWTLVFWTVGSHILKKRGVLGHRVSKAKKMPLNGGDMGLRSQPSQQKADALELPGENGQILFCIKCGEKLVPQSCFCPNCGAKLRKEEEDELPPL